MRVNITRSTVDKSVSIVLSFILFIVFFSMTLLIGIYSGLFHKSVLINNIYISDYGDDVIKYLYSECEDITLSSGVPITAIDNVFEDTIVRHDINKYAEASLEGKEYEIDTTDIENNIRNNINTYITTQGITLDEEQNGYLDEYIKTICDEYIKDVKVPFIDKFCYFRDIFSKVFIYGILISLFLTALIVFLIYRTNKWKHRTFRYLTYSVISTAFSTIILPVILLAVGDYKKIGLSPEYFYKLVVSTISELLKSYIYIGVLWIIVAVLLSILIVRFKNSNIDKKIRKV